ncbi:hypothetical protein PG990_014607 [Apiospora arundinis]
MAIELTFFPRSIINVVVDEMFSSSSSSSRVSSPWIARLVAKGRADKERRAEFQFATDKNQNFEFMTLVKGSYDNVTGKYVSLGQNRWPRSKWKVGIACNRFFENVSLDRLGHWGVYITRAGAESSKAAATPARVFKIYGFNWTNDGKGMQLEAIWEIGKEEKRDLTKQEFQAIVKSTEGAKSDQFGGYEERELYFSWPEFVLIAQFVLQEFVFEALRISPEGRTSKRAMEGVPLLSPQAYSLPNRNCQDYCRMLLNKMSENRWEDPDRLKYAFVLENLEKEWRSKDNSWAKAKGWGQKQLVEGFLSARGLELIADEGTKLEPMNPTDAERLWTDLVSNRNQKSRQPRRSGGDGTLLLSLLGKLDHCELAIRLAAAYVIQNQTPVEGYLKVLTETERDLDQNDRIATWFHESNKRIQVQLKQGMKIAGRGVALAWLTSFKALERIYSTPGRGNSVVELLSFITCLSSGQWIPNSLLFNHSPARHQEDPATLLCNYSFLEQLPGDVVEMHSMVYMLIELWFQCVSQVDPKTALKAMDKIGSNFPTSDVYGDEHIMYSFHARHALHIGERYNTKERSDLSFVLGQYLMGLSSRYPKGSSLGVDYSNDGIKYLEYTWQWRRENNQSNVQGRLVSLHALIDAYHFHKERVDQVTEKLIKLRKEVLEIHIKKRPEGLSGLLDARQALARESKNPRPTLEGRLVEAFKNIVVAETKDLRRTDPLRLRAVLELGKVYVDNGDYKNAVPWLNQVLKDGSEASPKDKLWYVTSAMENLETIHVKLSQDNGGHEMRKRKNDLFQSLRRHDQIWAEWERSSPVD